MIKDCRTNFILRGDKLARSCKLFVEHTPKFPISGNFFIYPYHTVDCGDCRNKTVSSSIHKIHQIIATDLYDLAKYESDRKFLGKIANQRGNLTLYESERFSQLCNELGGAV